MKTKSSKIKTKSSNISTKVMYSLKVLGVECKLLSTTHKKNIMYSCYFRYPKDITGEVKVIIYENETFRSAVSRFTLELRNMYEEHIHECNMPLPI